MPHLGQTFPDSLFAVTPGILPALDPGFRPLAAGVRNFRRELARQPRREPFRIALEQGAGAVSRMELELFPEGAGRDADNLRYAAWVLNFMIWSRGGRRAWIQGPAGLCAALAARYRPEGPHAFDARLMGQAFAGPFEVRVVPLHQLPLAQARPLALGGHLEGCRIGFDLGASDYKVAAVRDGETVFSAELPWDPRNQPDPAYHYGMLNAGLELAAAHLPRVDAIGGSSAGIIVDNRIRVASLFRAVPAEAFAEHVEPFFPRLQQAWGVPLEVINDGEVTALAGALSLGLTGILGIAMGSSEAAGYLDRRGRLTGWLNELAFAPIDANPEAGTDDWSGSPGIGAAYFSQQGVDRLARAAGMGLPPELGLPERLKLVQGRMEHGDPAARAVFGSIGVCLGYALAWYAEFYELDHAMILGRVTSGAGGEMILGRAREVLAAEFPELAERMSIFLPDEQCRRVGQAAAAASLPVIP
jgi:predicted NBD/HSP70 family sugar kinase